jgi:hypothetical protein
MIQYLATRRNKKCRGSTAVRLMLHCLYCLNDLVEAQKSRYLHWTLTIWHTQDEHTQAGTHDFGDCFFTASSILIPPDCDQEV